ICDDEGRPRDYRFLAVNPAFERLTGLKAADVVGKTVREVLPGIEPYWIETYGRVALTGQLAHFENYTQDLGRHYEVTAYRPAPGRFACIFTDITDRKRAEEKLKEREELYHLLFESGNDAIFIHLLDEDGLPGRFVEANEVACRRLGYSREELLALSPLNIALPETRENAAAVGRTLLEQGKAVFETVHVTRDGGHISVESGTRLFEFHGRKLVLSIARDITRRKQIEEALRESEERYRLLVEHAPEAIGVHTGHRFVYLNQAALRLLGASSPDQLLGQPVIERVHPDYRDVVSRRIKGLKDKGEPAPRIEEVFLRLDGSTVFVEVSAVPVVYDKQDSVLVFVNDITERKAAETKLRQSEERYRQITSALTDYIYTVHFQEGRYDYTEHSPACLPITGYTPEEFSADPYLWLNIVLEDDRPAVSAWSGKLLGGIDPGPIEHRIRRKDEAVRWIRNTAVFRRAPSGEVLSYDGLIRDITDRKKAEEEKAHLEAQLRQTQKMEAIGTLAGGIAHDFNNILAAVIGYTQLAMMELPENTPTQRYLEQVFQATQRAKTLVQQILSFSRRSEQERKPIQLAPIIKETLKLLRSSIPTTIEIRRRLEPETGAVLADPTEIHQVLMNLCANAAFAMRDKGGVLEVSLGGVFLDPQSAEQVFGLPAGRYQVLTVSDTGHGMDREVLARIFEPFFTTKKPGEGTGMGLAVVYGIVKSYNGAIKVYSEPGQGSTFKILLPLIEAESESRRRIAAAAMPRGTERILFVDDEPALADLAGRMFQRLGYQVTTRTSSLEALETFQAQPEQFDLIITDQTMPHLTGIELAREAMQIRPRIPVILCTGFSQQVSAEMALEMGVRKFLLKPLVISEAARIIREVLDEARSG
ncbi:MAG: PAS domain S-box protein, partial [Thermodesulfobacteriota bacterium]